MSDKFSESFDMFEAARRHPRVARTRVTFPRATLGHRLLPSVGAALLALLVAANAAAGASRGFELVSPANKEGTELPAVGAVQATPDGERVAFAVRSSFGEPSASGVMNDYMSERGPTGWSTRALAPQLAVIPVSSGYEFLAFSPDLSQGILLSTDLPNPSPGESPNDADLYLADDTLGTGTYSLITTQPRVEAESDDSADPRFSWASRDLRHVLFRGAHLVYFTGGPSFGAYYASEGNLFLASTIPDESTADPDDEIPAPAALPGAGTGEGGTVNSISRGGSRVFFTAVDSEIGTGLVSEAPSHEAQLYVRKNPASPDAESVRVSAPEDGVVDPTGRWAAWFRAASEDGSRAFFTSCQKLTADSTADSGAGNDFRRCRPELDSTKSDLYLFLVDANGGAGDLVDLTTQDAVNGADVRGFVGASRDGRRAYFVATGLLDPDEVGGDTGAVAGQPSLYVWEEGEGVEHVARLDPGDSGMWLPPEDVQKDSKVTPDGRYVAFASRRVEPGFDNNGHRMVYIYDAETDELQCASCTGIEPAIADATLGSQGGAELLRSAWFEKQNVTNDGRLVFFETASALVGEDTNGEVDVYEFTVADGSVALVSGGRSSSGSHFAGSAVDGSSVFFTTRARLVGWDEDDARDLYAARVGGGFPEPNPPADCGLDCQGLPSVPPTALEPGSGFFKGPGNLAPPRRQADLRVQRLSRRQLRRLSQGRKVVLRVRVGGPGRLQAVVRARIGKRMRRVASDSRRARRAGAVRMVLRLSPSARRQLAGGRRLRAVVMVEFRGERRRQRLSLQPAPRRAAVPAIGDRR